MFEPTDLRPCVTASRGHYLHPMITINSHSEKPPSGACTVSVLLSVRAMRAATWPQSPRSLWVLTQLFNKYGRGRAFRFVLFRGLSLQTIQFYRTTSTERERLVILPDDTCKFTILAPCLRKLDTVLFRFFQELSKSFFRPYLFDLVRQTMFERLITNRLASGIDQRCLDVNHLVRIIKFGYKELNSRAWLPAITRKFTRSSFFLLESIVNKILGRVATRSVRVLRATVLTARLRPL